MSKFTRSTPATTVDLYAEVTNQIIAALEAGTTPWVCPWDWEHGSRMPANLTTVVATGASMFCCSICARSLVASLPIAG